MFSFVCAWTNSLVNNRDAGDLRRHRAHYDVTLMSAVPVLTDAGLRRAREYFLCFRPPAVWRWGRRTVERPPSWAEGVAQSLRTDWGSDLSLKNRVSVKYFIQYTTKSMVKRLERLRSQNTPLSPLWTFAHVNQKDWCWWEWQWAT